MYSIKRDMKSLDVQLLEEQSSIIVYSLIRCFVLLKATLRCVNLKYSIKRDLLNVLFNVIC